MQKDSGSGGSSTTIGSTARRRRRGSNEVPSEIDKENGSHLLVNDNNKYKSMLIRTYSSVWMIGGFVFVIYMGHLYIWAMVVVIQIFMAKELLNLLRRAHEDRRLPGFRILNWWGGPDFLASNIFSPLGYHFIIKTVQVHVSHNLSY